MRRHGTAGRKPAKKTQHRKPKTQRRSNALTAARSPTSSTAGLREKLKLCARGLNAAQKKLDLRTRELSEAFDQQKATSEILWLPFSVCVHCSRLGGVHDGCFC